MPRINTGVLKTLRENAGLTQTSLAESAGITGSALCRIETGKHRPKATTIRKIADALHVPLDRLISKSAIPTASLDESPPPRTRRLDYNAFFQEFESRLLEKVKFVVSKQITEMLRTVVKELR